MANALMPIILAECLASTVLEIPAPIAQASFGCINRIRGR